MSAILTVRTQQKLLQRIIQTVDIFFVKKTSSCAVGRKSLVNDFQQIRHLSLKRALTNKQTIYDLWNSYESEPGVRRNVLCKKHGDKLAEKPIWTNPDYGDKMHTAWDLFQHGRRVSQDGRCVGWREGDTYKWWGFNEVHQRAEKLANGLNGFGLKRQDCVGIYAGPSPTWIVAALACTARSFVLVPIHDTFGPDNCSYILNQAEIPLLFVDKSGPARRILEHAEETPSLRTLVMFETPDKEVVELAKKKNITLKTLAELSSQNQSSALSSLDLPKPEDLWVIIYTSGTTGVPKGVPHTHKGIVADIAGFDGFFGIDRGAHLRVTPNDITFKYLPLSHAFGLINSIAFFSNGAAVGFFGGNVLKLLDDARLMKPTHIAMVPRIMNRMYSTILAEVEKSKIKSTLFWYAYNKKKEMLHRGIITKTSIWDKIVFKKIQAIIGGNVWFLSCGSAPIAPEVLEFWRVVFGVMIMEAYGQSECVAGVSAACDAVGGNIGHPYPCNEIKLAEAPECGYHLEDGRGEICVRGPNVMTGYYKRPDLTAEVLDKDGWLRTGDIGEFLPNGALKVIDRKKNIFKLAQGVYVAPERIENIYLLCPEILQIYVDGNSLQDYLVAIVVADPVASAAWATKHNVDPKTLSSNKDFIKFIFDTMTTIGKKDGLKSYELVKAIRLVQDPFSIDNGLLTPTFKNKRPELRKAFNSEIDALYKAGPLI